jgi:Transposase, Mutator family
MAQLAQKPALDHQHSGFYFRLVARPARPRRQDCDFVMRRHLGVAAVDLRLIKAGLGDPRLPRGRLYYPLPLAHHKHMKSINMLERFNQELKRRTRVVRIFPHVESCLRLMRALRSRPTRTGTKVRAT